MVVGDPVISISGVLSKQERLDKQQMTARDPDDFALRLSKRKDRLLETWFKFHPLGSFADEQRKEKIRKLFFKYLSTPSMSGALVWSQWT